MSLNIDPVAFTLAWQKAACVEDVAKRFGLTPTQARSKAAYMRRSGLDLKPFRRRMTDKERAQIRRALR